jgi:septum formation protein
MPEHTTPQFPELILASRSPRRRELLAEAGFRFRVVTPSESVEGGLCGGESPVEYVARLARQKAQDVISQIDVGIVLAADTIAEFQGQILGKPIDERHARQMLTLLRGTTHFVHTGVCLWRSPEDEPLVGVDSTKLSMDEVSDTQLDEYLDSGAWEGKAGAFGYQDRLGWIHIVEGSESNVVGLPMEMLSDMLQQV